MNVRYAVVGCGYWGPNIIRNLLAIDGATVTWICDLDERRLSTMRARFGDLRTTVQFDDLLAAPDVDAIVLATPSNTHFPLGVRALRAGKHLIVEKPLAPSLTEAQALVDEAKRQNRVLLVDHTFVYNSAVRKIKAALDSGDLGSIYYIDSVRVNLGLFQQDVNVLWDLAPHDLSIIDYLLDGELPATVSAVGAAHVGHQENLAYLALTYGSGLMAHVSVNWLAPVKVRQMFVAGSQKMLVYDDTSTTEKIRIYDRGAKLSSREEIYGALVEYRMGDMWAPLVDSVESLHREFQEHTRTIADGAPSSCSGEAGVRVVGILEAAQASVKAGGTPVAISV